VSVARFDVMFRFLLVAVFLALTSGFTAPGLRGNIQMPMITMQGGKGFGGGEATRDPAPTAYDPNDPKGKQQAIHKAESFAEYLAKRDAGAAPAASAPAIPTPAPAAPVAAAPAPSPMPAAAPSQMPMDRKAKSPYAVVASNDFRHGVGRQQPVPLGGTQAWAPGPAQMAPPPAQPRRAAQVMATKKYAVSTSDMFRHGTGRVAPGPLGGA